MRIPTAFLLYLQAPSQSETEPEKALLCHVPLPPPSEFAEMNRDHAQSSASRVSEEGDKEDEFGYSWSKLSFLMHLIVRGTKIALCFSRLMPCMNKNVSALDINTEVLCRNKKTTTTTTKHCLFLLEYSMHSPGMKSFSSLPSSLHSSESPLCHLHEN